MILMYTIKKQFHRSGYKQYFLSSLVQSVFIVFSYDFEQAKHIQ